MTGAWVGDNLMKSGSIQGNPNVETRAILSHFVHGWKLRGTKGAETRC